MEKFFRGIGIKSGNWEYGTKYNDVLVNMGGGKMVHRIFINGQHVISKTLGQMIYQEGTGLNTIKVFEGDVIELFNHENEEKYTCEVEEFGLIYAEFGEFDIWTVWFAMNAGYKLKVIKSIHD